MHRRAPARAEEAIPRVTSLAAPLLLVGPLVFAAAGVVAAPDRASALPLYAAREGKPCAHCHIDPGGGGPRNETGQYYEAHDHSFEAYQAPAAGPSPGEAHPLESLLEALSFSGNLRLVYSAAEGSHDAGPRSPRCESCHAAGDRAPDQGFFIMQGELAVSARVSGPVSFFYANDLGITRDAYAVIRLGSSEAFLKAGLFEVPFGIEEIKDHNSLVKARHNVGANLRDVGVQAAVQGARRFASLAILNGGRRAPDAAPVPLFGSWFDENGSPAVALRGGVLSPRFRLGASLLFDDSTGTRPRETVGGIFGSVFGSRWRVSGEVDVGRVRHGGSDTTNVGLVALATVEVHPSLDLSAKLDWFDSDTETSGDTETWYSLIARRRLARNATVEARYRIRDEGDRAPGGSVANDDAIAMLHVQF